MLDLSDGALTPGRPALQRPVRAELRDRAYWVDPRGLMAGGYPGRDGPVLANLRVGALRRQGISHVISLQEPSEEARRPAFSAGYETSLQSAGIGFSRFPIPDLDIPSAEQMVAILDEIDDRLAAGEVVYLHCSAGIGRAGTVAGAWLVRHGMAAPDEIAQVLEDLRSGLTDPVCAAPQTPVQLAFIEAWSPGR